MDEQKNSLQESQEQKTNSEKILSAIKKHKKLYYKTLPIAFIASFTVFSVPIFVLLPLKS